MGDDRGPHVRTVPTQEFLLSAELLHLDIWRRKEFIFIYSWLTAVVELAYGRLSKINILADKPIPAERSEGPSEQSGLAAGGIAPGGMPPVDHPGGPWEIDFILIEPRNNLAFILFRSG